MVSLKNTSANATVTVVSASAKGRISGRPRSLDEKQLTAVRTLLADSELSVAEIAHQHHVNPATIYRAFPGGRKAMQAAG